MRDAQDDGKKALRILKEHYLSSSKPRIITLYTELTSLIKGSDESITDYVLRAETAAAMLKAAKEIISDSLLVAMVLKGLSDDYQALVAVVTQSESEYSFQKLKQALRSFEETERHKMTQERGNTSVMKSKHSSSRYTPTLTCYSCGREGHKYRECPDKKCLLMRIGEPGEPDRVIWPWTSSSRWQPV